MLKTNRITLEAAREYLHAYEIHVSLSTDALSDGRTPADAALTDTTTTSNPSLPPPSILAFELCSDSNITLNVAFQSMKKQVFLEISESGNSASTSQEPTLQAMLFGNKSHAWLSSILGLLQKIRLGPEEHHREKDVLHRKLQIVIILMAIVLRQLSSSCHYHAQVTHRFVRRLLRNFTQPGAPIAARSNQFCRAYVQQLRETSPPAAAAAAVISKESEDELLQVGLPLLLALWQVFEFYVSQWTAEPEPLQRHLLDTHRSWLSELCSSRSADALPSTTDSPAHVMFGSSARRQPLPVSKQHLQDPKQQQQQQQQPIYNENLHDVTRLLGEFQQQARFFPMPILLSLNAMLLEGHFVTGAYLQWLSRVGDFLGWELRAAHDISRMDRDQSVDPSVVERNTVVAWHQQHPNATREQSIRGFLQAIQRQHHTVLELLQHEALPYYRVEQVESAVAMIRSWYQVEEYYSATNHQ